MPFVARDLVLDAVAHVSLPKKGLIGAVSTSHTIIDRCLCEGCPSREWPGSTLIFANLFFGTRFYFDAGMLKNAVFHNVVGKTEHHEVLRKLEKTVEFPHRRGFHRMSDHDHSDPSYSPITMTWASKSVSLRSKATS